MLDRVRNGSLVRSRWAAVGAAVAVALGGGGVGWIAHAEDQSAAGSGVAASFVSITPCRLFDTRPLPDNVGNRGTPLGLGETFDRAVWGTNGNCTIPSTATGITYNLTVPDGQSGYLTVYPGDAAPPGVSSINPVSGECVKVNGGVVGLSATGGIKIFTNNGPVNVLMDITGYFITATKGFAPWDVIPSGQTVTGVIAFDVHQGTAVTSDRIAVDLPGVAPVALTNSNVNFRDAGTGDADATCLGTYAAPTAPSGKVCIYKFSSGGINLISLNGLASLLSTRAFIVEFLPIGSDNGEEYLNATWAYTAP